MRLRWQVTLSCVPTVLLLLIIMLPVLGHPTRLVLGPFGGIDAVMQAGILEWTGRHLLQPGVWPGLPIFYPATSAATFMDSLLGQALLVAPLRVLPGVTPGLMYNIALLSTLLLAGAGIAFLWRASGGKLALAGWACLALLGSPFTSSQLGHLNQLPPPPLLFALAALLVAVGRTLRDDAGIWLPWWGWGAALVWQAAWGWYGTAYAWFASLIVLGFGIWRAWRIGLVRRMVRQLAGPLLLATLGTWGLASPYMDTARKHSDFERSDMEIAYYSADLKHFLNPGTYRLESHVRQGGITRKADAFQAPSRTVLHPGWVALTLALVGWFGRRNLHRRQQSTGKVVLVVGLLGLVLAFGDTVGLPGLRGRLPLPMGILQDLIHPLRALRTVWRFSFLFVVAVAWWAAAGGQVLWQWPGRERLGRGLAVGLLGLMLLESHPVALPTIDIPSWAKDPTTDPLRRLPPGAVLTLPAPVDEYAEDLNEATWLHRSLSHGHPVTGGVSGWVPPQTRTLRAQLAACAAGNLDFAELWSGLQVEGVRYIEIADPADAELGGIWRRILAQQDLPVRSSVPGFSYHGPDIAMPETPGLNTP